MNLMTMSDKKRHTGRTTRMLQEAMSLAHKGVPVMIVAGSTRDANRLAQLFRQMCDIECCSHLANACAFTSIRNARVEWESLRLVGAPETHHVLVDHFAIECMFQAVMEMWSRWDTVAPLGKVE